jgi:hypothetical protein
VARAHRGAVRQALDRQRLADAFARPSEYRRKTAVRPVGLRQRRELRLAARPAMVDDELLRSALGDGLAEILRNKRQREVDTGGDPG